ncbi:MAG TPA: methyltransferase domain-containing protein [Myxococcota bacterium]|nr:methyltransferase domain-containing protein [Myxococcota bacterium]
MAEFASFFRAFLAGPARIGSVAPSSPALARAMVAYADLRPGQVVVELGAGTGPFTRALAQVPGISLIALEPDPNLARLARAAAPGVAVEERYAQDLPEILRRHGHDGCDRVVSGLPFAGWSSDLQRAVFDAIGVALRPGGRMVTFTYVHSPWLPAGRRARALLRERFERVEMSPIVWSNLPPAFVYVCDRASPG